MFMVRASHNLKENLEGRTESTLQAAEQGGRSGRSGNPRADADLASGRSALCVLRLPRSSSSPTMPQVYIQIPHSVV